MLLLAGDLAVARERYEASLELRRALSAANPSSAEAKRDEAASLIKLGDVLVQAGDLAGARERYEASLELARALSASNPSSAEPKRDLAVSYERLGKVALASGEMWRMADQGLGGVSWADVAAELEKMSEAGTLAPVDEPFLEQARAKAEEEATE